MTSGIHHLTSLVKTQFSYKPWNRLSKELTAKTIAVAATFFCLLALAAYYCHQRLSSRTVSHSKLPQIPSLGTSPSATPNEQKLVATSTEEQPAAPTETPLPPPSLKIADPSSTPPESPTLSKQDQVVQQIAQNSLPQRPEENGGFQVDPNQTKALTKAKLVESSSSPTIDMDDREKSQENDSNPAENDLLPPVSSNPSITTLTSDPCDKPPEPDVPSTPVTATTTTQGQDKLEFLKQALSPFKFTCTLKRNEATQEVVFVDHLLDTLFRRDEVTTCSFDETTQKFTLTYTRLKVVPIKEVPDLGFGLISSITNQILSVFKPELQISEKISGEFIQEAKGITITFEPSAISLKKTAGHLKSISILKDPKANEDKHLFIKVHHEIPAIERVLKKEQSTGHQFLANFLDIHFFPQYYQKPPKKSWFFG